MWVCQDKQTVLCRFAEGATIQTIVPHASGALDELVALSAELETFRMLDALDVTRERQGIPDWLLLHTLAVLPFLAVKAGLKIPHSGHPKIPPGPGFKGTHHPLQ